MAKRADFKARAALVGIDDLNLPWKRALKKAERRAGRSFSKIERAGARATRALRKGFRGAGRAVGKMGKAAGVARRGFGSFARVGGVVTAGLAVATDKAGKFELEVARLGNLLDASIDPVAEYSDMLKKMAVQFATDPIETARAAYMAFSGGVETSKEALQEFLPVALKSAKAGFAEPAAAVDVLTTALDVFGRGAGRAAAIADQLFVTEALGKTDFAQMAGEIGQIASFAKEMGLELEDVLAPMAVVTKGGLATGAAFTQIGALLTGIVAPAEKFRKTLKKFGLPFGTDAVRNVSDLTGWVDKLKAAVDKHGEGVIVKVLGRKEARKAAFRLAGSGFKDLHKITAGMGDSAGRMEQNFENLQKRMGFKIQQMKTGFSLLVTELGGGIAEGLGLKDLDSIPERVEAAGKGIRKGAKGFAEGFIKALAPGKSLSEIDWTEVATSAGKAFGQMANLLGRMVRFAAKAIDTIGQIVSAIAGIAGDKDPGEEAAKKLGARRIRIFRTSKELYEAGQISRADYAKRTEEKARRLIRQHVLGIEAVPEEAAKPGQLGLAAEHAAGLATRRGKIQKAQSEAAAGALTGRVTGFGLPISTEGLARQIQRSQNIIPPQEVGGEVKITIDDKTQTKSVSVEATSKNPRVPIKASVGKRKTGTG